MDDLISKPALLKALEQDKISICSYVYSKVNPAYADELEEELEWIINSQPTVDAVPVVYGEWSQRTDYDDDNNAYFECSNCHHRDKHAKGVVVPFCWFCGAYMKGE